MSEEYDYEEATPEERLRIASHFILSSPNGEVDDVIADVKMMMGKDSLLTDDVIVRLLKQYNTENYEFADLQDGSNLLVSKTTEKDGKFLNPANGKKMAFDHVKRRWIDEKTAKSESTDTKSAEHRAAVEASLVKYMKEFYVDEKNWAIAVFDNGDETLSVLISSKKVNLKNFWSGGWKATYKVDLKEGKLESQININVHYFEEGNVQLNTNFTAESDIDTKSKEAVSSTVVNHIRKQESDLQKKMEEMYLNMHTQTFKAMRRFLPITKTKMNWDANAHKLAQNMSRS